MEIKRIDAQRTWKLRQKVMWPDKDIDYIKLKDDHKGIHYGLYIENELVSVISLFFNDKEAQIRKFATDTKRQKGGYGTKLLQYVITEAVNLGIERIWCHARTEKISFYKKFGMNEEGRIFDRDGKSYITMSLVTNRRGYLRYVHICGSRLIRIK
ncbi:GNAT family N-acetyltransferase [Pelosinus sp. IPA-1]|uniref:GNAT family N-acetyltransferase n=1 Tax=Pelosinus sp. IPA-1 TaxID=3029569 RepID=UPI0024361910|nr:GNAT family N-acetyltransferase [Pelosinus sp. IPA-1]GMA97997.1 hypothetical protein PIPA1_07970 [Pelosinus sp. IPA-1]